ncbi:MAG: hypothetical protein ABWX92_07775 [Mycetocola sp.]
MPAEKVTEVVEAEVVPAAFVKEKTWEGEDAKPRYTVPEKEGVTVRLIAIELAFFVSAVTGTAPLRGTV